MKKKYLKSTALGLLACIIVGGNTYAGVRQVDNDVKFSKKFIDDTTFTTVATGEKRTENARLKVKIIEMYDENGKVKENWKRTIWKVYKGGERFSADTVVQKDVVTKIELDQKAKTGTKLKVKSHGNKENLDAMITGYIYDFKK